eukprot:6205986-Pleurochrysis_carterae.AAC.4
MHLGNVNTNAQACLEATAEPRHSCMLMRDCFCGCVCASVTCSLCDESYARERKSPSRPLRTRICVRRVRCACVRLSTPMRISMCARGQLSARVQLSGRVCARARARVRSRARSCVAAESRRGCVHIESTVKTQAPRQTIAMVRMPAGRSARRRSHPTREPHAIETSTRVHMSHSHLVMPPRMA